MKTLLNLLFLWPAKIASHFQWAGPVIARIAVGYTVMSSGLGKMLNLEFIIQNFTEWGIPFPHFTTPFVAGWELVGGLFIMLGLLTRICSGALALVMIVAIASAKWSDVHGIADLLGFEETNYFAVFFWLSIHGAGWLSLDRLIEQRLHN